MEIIPVIDLMGGIVVHARQGRRDRYRAIDTPLCPDSDPCAVVEAFLSLHPFRTLYIADLDALMGQAPQTALIGALAVRYQAVRFWVDGGWPAGEGPWDRVVGTESLDRATWASLAHKRQDWILSLDYLDGIYTGPPEILTEAVRWPDRVIVMCLNRVGSGAGPDWERLQQLRRLAPGHQLIAAGGVRDRADIERLQDMGIDRVLVASALHEGRLGF